MVAPTVGVLALQGAFAAHAAILDDLGVETIEIRSGDQLPAADALVIPGGESTTMSHLLRTSGIDQALRDTLAGGLPVLGTCAGMIMLASEIVDGRPDQEALGIIDLTVRRNGYGRQLDSFEADIDVAGFDSAFHAVFIRAPVVERVGEGIQVLASVSGDPVLCRQGAVTVAAFHPELSGDTRIHRRWLSDAGL